MTDNRLRQLFNGFIGREEALKKILRYNYRQKVMFYRTNDWIHSKKVYWITKDLASLAKGIFGDRYNADLAQMLALVHDDLEIVIGDIQAGDKARMTEKQKVELKKREWAAVKQLIKKFPRKLGNYNYADLLECAWKVESLEAQLMKLVDKFDAYGEAMHEILAGNHFFTIKFPSPYGINQTPIEYYINYFRNFPNIFQELRPLLILKHPLFLSLPELDLEQIVKQGRPHTKETLYQNFGIAPYDYWKKVLIKNMSPEEIADLYTQREFLK